jgi:hypothetical protein
MKRKPISKVTRELALSELAACLEARIGEKGDGSFASIHEIWGCLGEEWEELKEAIHRKDFGKVESELMDVAVGAIFAYACLRSP